MNKNYDNMSLQEALSLVQKLEKELKRKQYGLVWDAEKEPEKVVFDCKKFLPVLTEDKNKAINSDEGQDNILIEGDNYHALQVLSYTHKGKIDVIYIDPPYNTGNKDFVYNDRFVDREDGYRHSKWLNFMEKRLDLARDLLTEEGVIFISIDDNEQANLKLLCDKIFGEENFVALLPRLVKKGGKSSDNVAKNNDYLLVYSRSDKLTLNVIQHNDDGFKHQDEYVNDRGLYKLNQTLDYNSIQYSPSLDYKILIDGEEIIPGGVSEDEMNKRKLKNPARDYCWRWSQKLFDFGLKNGFIVIKKYKNKPSRIYTKTYQNVTISKDRNGCYFIEQKERTKTISSIDFIENQYSNDIAKKELSSIFGINQFDYPKPSSLIKDLITLGSKKSSIVLDFMAGSGTTGHAVLSLNKEDGGYRKFILCTNNELNGVGSELVNQNLKEDKEKFGICQRVTYPRIEKVIKGYNKNGDGEFVDGLGGNLRYFKTDFIKNSANEDQLKINLARRCTEILSLKEGIFNSFKESDDFAVLKSNAGDRYLCIYYNFLNESFDDFLKELTSIKEEKTAYVFSLDDVIDGELFKGVENISLEPVPAKILMQYRKIMRKHLNILL